MLDKIKNIFKNKSEVVSEPANEPVNEPVNVPVNTDLLEPSISEKDQFLTNILEHIKMNPDFWSTIRSDHEITYALWDKKTKICVRKHEDNYIYISTPFKHIPKDKELKKELLSVFNRLRDRDEILCHGKKQHQMKIDMENCNKILEDSLPEKERLEWKRTKKLKRILK